MLKTLLQKKDLLNDAQIKEISEILNTYTFDQYNNTTIQ